MPEQQARVVVIGSGPAGSTAALRLLQLGIPVLMLESGPAYPAGLMVRAFGRNLYRKWPRLDDSYRYTATGDSATEWHNFLTPGGLSNAWTGAVPRFAPEDFTEGQRAHERYRWPVSYEQLAPYYTYVERLLQVVGERRRIPQLPHPEAIVHRRQLPNSWRTVAHAAEQLGHGLVYAPVADGPNWTLRRSGNAFNSFERIVARLSRFPGFELRLGAHAQQLIWSGSGRRVAGVEYVNRSTGVGHVANADAVVVAAGPLASPKLLLQSRSSDFPTGIGNSQGLLGRFVHDHPTDWCAIELDRPLARLDQPLHLSRAPYAQSTPLMAASLTIGPLSKWDRVVSGFGATTTRFGLVTFSTMRPDEDNFIRLHHEKRDQFGMPLLDVHLRFDEDVADNIAASHVRLVEIMERAGIGVKLDCPIGHRLTPGRSAHYGGGARMHASPKHGVLDEWNRLHDVNNVAVVDASSFTTGVEKNPTLTVMALAARAADRLADDLKSGVLRGRPESTRAISAVR